MKGTVVVVPFPFSDQSSSKKRPALVIIEGSGNDLVLAAISSSSMDIHGVPLNSADFANGQLQQPSVIRVSTLFTADRSIIIRAVGKISEAKHREVISKIISLLN